MRKITPLPGELLLADIPGRFERYWDYPSDERYETFPHGECLYKLNQDNLNCDIFIIEGYNIYLRHIEWSKDHQVWLIKFPHED